MRLRLQELQEANSEDQELKQQKRKSYEEIDKIFHHQSVLFISNAIWIELISHHHKDLMAGYFGNQKTWQFLAQKYNWPNFCHNVKAYVKSCVIWLVLKVVRHKPYRDLQSLSIKTHQRKNLSMDFVNGLSISID